MSIEIVYLVLLLMCVVLSAFFCSSETAFFSLQRIKVEQLLYKKVKSAGLVARIIERPERLLSTVLLGTNFVNTVAAALGTVLAVAVWGEETGVLVATVAVTIILLIFSETTPKTVAAHHAEWMSLLFTGGTS